jgi:hypothetical protein
VFGVEDLVVLARFLGGDCRIEIGLDSRPQRAARKN